MKRAAFLDRDGVLNRAFVRDGKPYPPLSLDQVEIPEGVRSALDRLKAHGFALIVVTNQPDVGRGTQTQEVVEQIHAHLRSILPLDDVLVCYHTDQHGCSCRKPKPGLLLAAAEKLNIDLSRSFMIGDRWRDVEAGQNAGCRTILLESSYDERRPVKAPDWSVTSLREAADWIIEQSQPPCG
jgi:D-glycero-D-manno-heptose 1,7-bisphosphate phosphatase